MIKSMTGFGRGTIAQDNFSVAVDLKTVNNRFLDVHLRLPSELSNHEPAIRNRINARLTRGRVDVTLTIERTGEVVYELNRPLIGGYISALRAMQQEFQLSGVPDINTMARLPGIMQPSRNEGDEVNAQIGAGIIQAIDAALDELDEMRAHEGAALATAMLSHVAAIEKQLPVIESIAGKQIDVLRARLHKKIEDMLSRSALDVASLDAGRLAQEVAYLADRSDITEEIERLRSHLSQFQLTLNSDGEKGKRLDFLLQEFNREANTILSKSTDVECKEAALAIKADIEKIREQVQNVE
ncbi:MAG: YicC family protein [Pyrinomonadaceae bacterium MAG19_C2-C3]|nr:YicC family protein [Pyrinomonadaceae bacterium MAG19_C2-C3]